MTLKKFTAVAALALPTVLFAQKEILISEAEKDISAGKKNSYIMVIPQTKAKDVNEDWQKMVKKDAKGKVEEANGEIKTSLITVKTISAAPLNIYAKMVETTEGVQLTTWFADGDSFIATTYSADKSLAVQKYLHDFGVQEYKAAVQKELADEQKKQKDLDKIYDGFVKDQKKAEKEVSDAQKDIEKLKAKNIEEEGNIKEAMANKKANQTVAGQQKDLDSEKKHTKQLEGYIKDQKKAEDNIKSNNKRIERLQEKISEENANADKAIKLQVSAKANTDAQKTVVTVASEKLNGIK